VLAPFTAAAKEEMLSAFAPWSADECISAFESQSKKPHQGVAPENPALHQGIAWSNSKTALGLRSLAVETRVRSRCTGKERDSESGLDNFEARYLGSSLGRFMSPDPMGGKTEDPQSLNRYAYVRNNPLTLTDPSGMNFGLPCSGGNTDTCNNGLQGSWQHDQDGNKTTFDPVSIGNKDGTLQDVSSNKTGTYTASFDGSNVSLTNSGGTAQNGSWLQGTAAVSGVSGGGNLSSKFDFTFSDHGNGQSLNATFTYAGKFSEAQSELYKAGYSFSALDQMFNVREMFANPNAENYRTPGDPGTGANSGHFLVNHSIVSLLPQYSVPTTGSVHTGETNPTTSPGALWQHWTKEQ
jgi:RHS repeat-associated protein